MTTANYKHICPACYKEFGSSSKARKICPDCANAIIDWQPIIELLEKDGVTSNNILWKLYHMLIDYIESGNGTKNDEELLNSISRELFPKKSYFIHR